MRKADRFDGGRATRGREVPGAPAAVPEDGTLAAELPAAPAMAALSQQSVWYRLMKLTNLINRPFFSRYAERYRLTINDARVLVTLASMSNAAAHELCQATGMHPMNVSRSVATLRRQGRIAERRDPHNGRRKILRLTSRGWSVCRSFVPDMDEMSEFLLCSMSTPEVQFLSRLVDQLIERLESASGDDSLVGARLPPERSGARALR
jgi:MarR family transcriptional regulator, lower aerobic nicotinate degradation pathway regulator